MYRKTKTPDMLATTNSTSANSSNSHVSKRKFIQWTYGEKSHILKIALTAKAKGQTFVSAAKALGVNEQTVYGFLRDRTEIEEVVNSMEGGTAVKKNRKNNNLSTINMMVLNKLSACKSGTSTTYLMKAARETGAKLRIKLLKEQVLASKELARLENFKASRPWAKKLVVRLRNGCLKNANVQESDQIGFGLTPGNITTSTISSISTEDQRLNEFKE
jgi:hypothetical protein